jgi:hypothetical protein
MDRESRNVIPQHCIDFFIKKFNTYPSFIEVKTINVNDKIVKYLDKFHLVWFHDKYVNSDEPIKEKRLYEYDSNGIMVYIYSDDTIFIFTTPDRKNASEFFINTLKRIK